LCKEKGSPLLLYADVKEREKKPYLSVRGGKGAASQQSSASKIGIRLSLAKRRKRGGLYVLTTSWRERKGEEEVSQFRAGDSSSNYSHSGRKGRKNL